MSNERIDDDVGLGLGAVLYCKGVLEPVFSFETVEEYEGGSCVLGGFQRQGLAIKSVDSD